MTTAHTLQDLAGAIRDLAAARTDDQYDDASQAITTILGGQPPSPIIPDGDLGDSHPASSSALYDRNEPTARLAALTAGTGQPDAGDLRILGVIYAEGMGYAGGSDDPSENLADFADWMTGQGPYAEAGCSPAQIIW